MINGKKSIIRGDKNIKVTFEVIEKMHYADFNGRGDDDFKPSDILDIDEEETVYS